MNNAIILEVECPICGKVTKITVEINDYIDWKCGKLVQNAFPYLKAKEREMLISGICGECWEKMFGEECA